MSTIAGARNNSNTRWHFPLSALTWLSHSYSYSHHGKTTHLFRLCSRQCPHRKVSIIHIGTTPSSPNTSPGSYSNSTTTQRPKHPKSRYVRTIIPSFRFIFIPSRVSASGHYVLEKKASLLSPIGPSTTRTASYKIGRAHV